MSKTYAEFINETLNDKMVEILIGESYEELTLDQMSSHYPAVIIGKVISACGNALVLDCLFIKNRKHVFGKKLIVNDFAIKMISEVDDKCTLEDLLLRGRDTRAIKKLQDSNEI